jgi:hypothetical protein
VASAKTEDGAVGEFRKKIFSSELMTLIITNCMTGKVGRRGRGGNFLWKNIFFVFFTLPDIRTKQGPQRVMGFAWKPAIKAMYNKELDVHFDGTFMMTHNGFQQVCVL